jgi:hypothetical protein
MPSSSQTKYQNYKASHGAYSPTLAPSSNLPLFSSPDQEHVTTGSYKIPTIVYYDQEGNMTAGGAEAEGRLMADLAEHCGWIKAELCALSSSSKPVLRISNALTIDSSFDSGPKL